MEILISNSSGIPIYEQIKEQIKKKIITQELKSGELLPSIRSLAKDLRCSVITTKNAYEELQKEGYIKAIPSKGFYVANINLELAKEEQLKEVQTLLEKALKIAKMYNIEHNIVKQMMEILMEGD